jgi:predicted flap endonuclease-1-like 5' DNA nuclease
MTSVFEAYLVPIIIALAIGVVVAWWMFKRRSDDRTVGDVHRPGETVEAPPPVAPVPEVKTVSRDVDGPEGNSIVDQGAAAATDVAGQVLGVPVHSQIPGASGPPDDLQMLKGVGPKLATKLSDNGIMRFEQLARLSPNEVAILEDKLGPFKGRLTRDRVVEQAQYLARGDKDGFQAKFGNLG